MRVEGKKLVLTSVVRVSLIEKVTSEQRHKGDQGHHHADIRGNSMLQGPKENGQIPVGRLLQ